MNKRLFYIVFFCLALALPIRAEVVVLRSGQIIKGEILLNNEEVIVLRLKNGTKYQYPQAEVADVKTEDSDSDVKQETHTETTKRNVTTQLLATAGAAYIPNHGWGGAMETHLRIGTRSILNQPIFLGGSVGYRGVFKPNNNYSWIPLQLAFQAPITLLRSIEHQPLLGASVGYAFATNKNYKGGLCAGMDVGMLFRLNQRTAISLSLTAQWQQTYIQISEIINHTEYANFVGCSIVELGLKFGVQF